MRKYHHVAILLSAGIWIVSRLAAGNIPVLVLGTYVNISVRCMFRSGIVGPQFCLAWTMLPILVNCNPPQNMKFGAFSCSAFEVTMLNLAKAQTWEHGDPWSCPPARLTETWSRLGKVALKTAWTATLGDASHRLRERSAVWWDQHGKELDLPAASDGPPTLSRPGRAAFCEPNTGGSSEAPFPEPYVLTYILPNSPCHSFDLWVIGCMV